MLRGERGERVVDGGDVVGTVTFSDGSWSETVDLEDASATVTAPAGVGSVTASYDGYTDGLVSPSTSSAVSLALEVTAAATTRCVAGKVVETITVTNADDIAATLTLTGAYGSKTLTVAPGKSVPTAFSTRVAEVASHDVSVAAQAADGRSHTFTVTVAARSCG